MHHTPVWDDHPWPGLPRLTGEVQADACVVGLGGSGLAAVGELLDQGLSVVGLDAGRVAGGAAGRNGGFVLAGLAAFYHDLRARLGRDLARRLYAHTRSELDRMSAETPDLIRRPGSLRIALDGSEWEDCLQHGEALRADGFPAEAYAGPEGRGLLVPGDGVFQPLQRCRTLAKRAMGRGAQLFENTPALEIAPGRVTTPQGSVHARRIVVAVDGDLEGLLPELAGRVRSVRLQMLATAPTDEVRLTRPVYARFGHDYWQQLPDGRVALGGGRDLGGEPEWSAPAEPGEVVQAHMDRVLREVVGVRVAPITRRWAARVGYTEGGLPVLEQVRDGVWACGAYSGTGNVLGARCGRSAARRAFGHPDSFAEALDAARA